MFEFEKIDFAKDIYERTAAYSREIWSVMATVLSPTADRLRELFFRSLWMEYVGHFIKTGRRNIELYQKMSAVLTQSMDEFVAMALDR